MSEEDAGFPRPGVTAGYGLLNLDAESSGSLHEQQVLLATEPYLSSPSVKMLINFPKHLHINLPNFHNSKPTNYRDGEGFLFCKVEDRQVVLG